jgi:hypothetical protein
VGIAWTDRMAGWLADWLVGGGRVLHSSALHALQHGWHHHHYHHHHYHHHQHYHQQLLFSFPIFFWLLA